METGEISFFMLRFAAVWRPLHWSSWRAWFYNIFTALMFLIMSFTGISMMTGVVMSMDIESLFSGRMMEFALVLAMCKGGVFVINRQKFLHLNSILNGIFCCPRVDQEWQIRRDILQPFKKYAAFFVVSGFFIIILEIIVSIVEDAPKKRLKMNAWFPFEWHSGPGFWISFVFQHVTLFFASFYDVFHDIVFSDYLYELCAQIAILQYRIKKHFLLWDKIFVEFRDGKTSGTQIFADHVQHYLCIIDFAEKVNNTFLHTIFMQFIMSTAMACCLIYSSTSISPVSLDFLILIVYIVLCSMQICLYCFLGDMVMQKSGDISSDIYKLDWTCLSPGFQKNLILMLARMSRPIQFTSGHIIILSNQTLASLLKLAYSFYNLLKNQT